jgi:DNA-directed RNA polymerase subunit E'/Rpb7
MTSTTTITQKIPLETMYLDSRVHDHLLSKLRSVTEGTCTLNNGYIISVSSITKILGNNISIDGSLVVFNVVYEAVCIKPTVGAKLSGKVCMVFAQGIFVDVSSKMKVLIPVANMPKFSYESSSTDSDVFVYREKKKIKKVIKRDMTIDIEIKMVKYDQKQFSCIGKLS